MGFKIKASEVLFAAESLKSRFSVYVSQLSVCMCVYRIGSDFCKVWIQIQRHCILCLKKKHL